MSNIEREGFQAFKEVQDGFAAEQYFILQMVVVKKNYGYLKVLDSYEEADAV